MSRHVHIILISTSGVLYQPIPTTLTLLGLSSADSAFLLRSLNLHSVRCAMSILKLRRQLELTPSVFTHRSPFLMRPPPPVDPP